MNTPRPPTDKQRAILAFVVEFTDSHGYGPTLRETMARFGWSSTNAANDHRRLMVRKGLLREAEGATARTSFLLTPAGRLAAKGVDVTDRQASGRLPKLPEDLAAASARHVHHMLSLSPGEVLWCREGGRISTDRFQVAR